MAATAETVKIKQGRKFGQVLEGARAVFMRSGFEGASVDDIAATAGVSKATLYSYFPDKRILFVEVAMRECRRQTEETEALVELSAPPRGVLAEAARRIFEFTTSEFGRSVYRICAAEAERFPELGRAFYDSGPALVRARIGSYLDGAVARGELVIEDVELASAQFYELCKADVFSSVSFGVKFDFTTAERDRIANGAVEMFMARYGTQH